MRTAVLTDLDGTVRFALIGQVVGEVFRVAAIDPDRVTLVNARTGQTSQLLLK